MHERGNNSAMLAYLIDYKEQINQLVSFSEQIGGEKK
jgi:hypothetical protein